MSGEVDALRARLETGELADLSDPARILEAETVFSGHVWGVKRERFAFGGGELVREFVAHTGAVAVLALDDDDRVLLINQYRHPIREREWELPAGLLDIEGEEPQAAAARELAEEVDLAADVWEPLAQFHTTPGGSDELLRIYRATGLTQLDAFDRGEEEAQIVRRWVALDEVVAAVLDGRLRNSILQIAVLTAHARRG
ncbi:NUDIX domain-containing protein [Schumannella sp. 10F1B-5-1]|uniref:NUDIX domain-containing protein n=1 Tax=Schumannella sp. 10F1B-5-1 TaxID=2590780 RepID=UPI001130BE77|nr:NUDIX hydrolase [Schumannella sp. 10F1B-5-1]TPW73736.1 NUDIX hydrolase [Schumannella sp. 10F1B-5-1]